jgi:hypothetical protein
MKLSSRNTPVDSPSPMSTPGAGVDTPPAQPTLTTSTPVDRVDIELQYAVTTNGAQHPEKEAPVVDEPTFCLSRLFILCVFTEQSHIAKTTDPSDVSIFAEGASSTTPIGL